MAINVAYLAADDHHLCYIANLSPKAQLKLLPSADVKTETFIISCPQEQT